MQSKVERIIKKEWLISNLPHYLLRNYLHHYLEPKLIRIHHSYRHEFHIPDAEKVNLSQYKTSDTIFILGSGWSINEITDSRWDEIKNCDSIGFNLWLAHDFIPSFYFFHIPDARYKKLLFYKPLLDQYLELVRKRVTGYKHIPKLLTHLHLDPTKYFLRSMPYEWKENLFALNTFGAIARNTKEINKEIDYLTSCGLFEANAKNLSYLFSYNGTIVHLMDFAQKLGYKKVIMCGVDMTDPRYFYNDSSRYPHLSHVRSSLPGKTHATLKSVRGHVALPEVVYALYDNIYTPRGIELYVENSCSALYPRIPVYC